MRVYIQIANKITIAEKDLVILKKNTIDIRKFKKRMKKTMQKKIKVETRIKLGMRTKYRRGREPL